ncbi:hypothetical protein R5R35_007457 [Gryllus longicercus]|uniref:ENTH domain-containing protein n=1 Tax=Gryllus longicercus TaxID=2509291 RepID=A0AAN9VDJ8_9ORTH
MQANMAGIRRNIVNLAHNYSDAQVKVREATSNDPWGPSSTIMSEIADLTYNVVAFTEIMQMIWKRLNDHGRNWRHVYKALVLLEYLIKTGTEKVAQQCKENIFAIQTLKDFQHFEGTKDQGLNVREKAKQLVQLLKDDERLRNERARALKAKERFAQAASGFGSDGSEALSPPSPSFPSQFQTQWPSSCESDSTSRELETARPQTVGEEELQLQLALAMSREEAEQEEQRRRSDDVRLQLALSQSEEEFKNQHKDGHDKRSHMLDLLDVNLDTRGAAAAAAASSASASPIASVLAGPAQPPRVVDPWGFPQPVAAPLHTTPPRPQNDPWSSPASVPSASSMTSPQSGDPWAPVPREPTPKSVVNDPWRAISPQPQAEPLPEPRLPARPPQDPWSPSTNTDHSSPGATSPSGDLDDFDIITNRQRPPASQQLINNANTLNNNGGTLSPDPFDLSVLDDTLSDSKQSVNKKTPHSFLGENSSLVNLDNLVARPASASPSTVPAVPVASANPFAGVGSAQQPSVFPQPAPPAVRPCMNQIRQQPFGSPALPAVPAAESAWAAAPAVPLRPPVLPAPLLPSNQPNPFLS